MAKIVELFGGGKRADAATAETTAPVSRFLKGYSLEVMPRTAAKIERFADHLHADARVYIAHIDGTPFEQMLETAARVADEGFRAMPHVPARLVRDRLELDDRLRAYRDVGVTEALVLAGGVAKPVGAFSDSMQLLETGLFDQHGFRRLHVAGHPEGNRDIDPDGSDRVVTEALRWKSAFAERTDADMAIVTQFLFDPTPAVAWARGLRAAGVDLPVHLGVAGPAKLQTLIKFAIACGVGPSLSVLQRRAADLTKLLLPFEPDEMVEGVAQALEAEPDLPIAGAHFFPLGGIKAATAWANARLASDAAAAQTA